MFWMQVIAAALCTVAVADIFVGFSNKMGKK